MSSINIYSDHFLDNKYSKAYLKIVHHRQNNLHSSGVYTEKHHIVPKSIGGQNRKQNLLIVSAREHFILHWLLTKMCHGQQKYKMLEAFSIFQNNKKRGIRLTQRKIQQLREANAIAASVRGIGNQAWRHRSPVSPERLIQYKEYSSKCRWINDGISEKFEIDHENLTCEGKWKYGRIKSSKPRKPAPPIQEETRQKLSIASKLAMSGKQKQESHKSVLSEQMKKQNKITCEHCGGIFGERNYKASHGEHCKLNPIRSQKQLDQEETARVNQRIQRENAEEKQCPYCGFASKQHSNLKRWHFDNCKHK